MLGKSARFGWESFDNSLKFRKLFQDKPTHQVHIYNLKGAWTLRNRNMMLKLYDGYCKVKLSIISQGFLQSEE